MGHLQEVHPWQAVGHQLGVEVLLEVAHQQESPEAGVSEQHDRDVVDGLPVVERRRRDVARRGPEDPERDLVQPEAIARAQRSVRRHAIGEGGTPGCIARAHAGEARLVRDPDAVPLEEQAEARDMILVGMREDDDVDPAVPRRQALVERDEQAARIRSAVDQHPPAATAFHEDRVTLAHVEDDDVRDSTGSVDDRERKGDVRGREAAHRDLRRLGQCWSGSAPAGGRPRAGRASRRAIHAVPGHRPARDSAAPPSDAEYQRRRGRGAHRVPWRAELHARQRQARAGPNDRHHRRVEAPRRQARQHREHRRHARPREHPHDQRQRPGRHRRRHERHDDEVHEGRDERQSAELEQDHRRRRRLCCE